ncbi:MAG: hypothetical protein ACR2HH_08270 [Chthoniobacterales bacterium]
MADLTDADKAKFVDDVIAALIANKAALIAKDWDPTARITNLGNGLGSIAGAQTTLNSAQVVLDNAQTGWRKLFDDNYDLATARWKGRWARIAPAVKALRGSRGAMHHAAAKKTT